MVLTPPKLRVVISSATCERELVKQPQEGWRWVTSDGVEEDYLCHTIVEGIRYAFRIWPGCEVLETNAEGQFIKNGPWVTAASRTVTGRN